MASEDEGSIRVYKCRLKSIFQPTIWTHVQPSIKDAVERVSKLAPEFSRFLQLHIQLSHLSQTNVTLNKKLMENIFMSLTTKNQNVQPRCWSDDLRNTYDMYMSIRSRNQPFVSRQGLIQILKFFFYGYLVNIQVYHENLPYNYLKKVVDSLVTQIYRNNQLPKGSLPRIKLHQFWQLQDIFEIDLGSNTLTTLKRLQEMVIQLEETFGNDIRLPKIALVPHFNFSRKFIRLDQKALLELFFVGDTPMAMKGRELVKENKAWSYLLRSKVISRKFNDSIVTDGYQVSVNAYKGEKKVKKQRLPKVDTEEEKQQRKEEASQRYKETAKERRSQKKLEFAASRDVVQVPHDINNFSFIDAGKDTFLQMFNLTREQILEYMNLSDQEKNAWAIHEQLRPRSVSHFTSIQGASYHHDCCFLLKYKRAVEWGTSSCVTIILQNMLVSLKTSLIQDTLLNIIIATEWLDEIMNEKLKERYAKLRFYVDTRKQVWWDSIVEKFRDTIVCLGNATNFGKAKGHRPTPIKFLIRFLRKKNIRLFLIDEHRTSKDCSSCGNELEATRTFRTKCCTTCKYQWNRDKNACINMFKRALVLLNI